MPNAREDPIVALLLDCLVPEIEKHVDEIVERKLSAVLVPQPDQRLTTTEAAHYLRLTPDALRARVRRGTLPAHRDEHRLLFHRTELDRHVQRDDQNGRYPAARQLTSGPAQRELPGPGTGGLAPMQDASCQDLGGPDLTKPRPRRRVRVAEGVISGSTIARAERVPAKFEFVYRDGTGRQVWQTSSGSTKASAKAERAEILARLQLGQRVERTHLTLIEAAKMWLERGTGQRGRWADSTRERYERIVRLHIEQSADPTRRPIGPVKLRELTPDRVAAWSQTNERALAPTTAVIALATLSLVCRYAVRRGWIADNPVSTLEPGEKPRWNPQHVGILEGDDLATPPRPRRDRTGSCSSSWPTPACGSGKHSDSVGQTSTSTAG